jgi:hypothetical protein
VATGADGKVEGQVQPVRPAAAPRVLLPVVGEALAADAELGLDLGRVHEDRG